MEPKIEQRDLYRPTNNKDQQDFRKEQKYLKENDLFKRRLIISKYANAVEFLKPSLRHSYADRVYNHQFKGALSTARRLFSLKVQYDQPLVHSLNYKSAIEHEGLVTIKKENQTTVLVGNNKSHGTVGTAGTMLTTPTTKSFSSGKTSLLEKGYSAPLYGAWDPQLRKLVLTNRYLNHKTVTTLASGLNKDQLENENDKQEFKDKNKSKIVVEKSESLVDKDQGVSKGQRASFAPTSFSSSNNRRMQKAQVQEVLADDSYLAKLVTRSNSIQENTPKISPKDQKNSFTQFSNWPLKQSYFKDNEFLVSQLYSNSQPIDSFLSQENEKARPVALSRRVNSFNTVLNYKNNVQPTNAQRSQQFLKIESNDKKTFLFKHFWNSSNTAGGLNSVGINGYKMNLGVSHSLLKSKKALSTKSTKLNNDDKTEPLLKNNVNPRPIGFEKAKEKAKKSGKKQLKDQGNNSPTHSVNQYFFTPSVNIPTSAEQRKSNRMEDRDYPLCMILRELPPNQGGFLWPGD